MVWFQFEVRVRMAGSAVGLLENGSTFGGMPWLLVHVRVFMFDAAGDMVV